MKYGIGWYSETLSIAQTGYEFTESEAREIAIAGSTAPHFWAWVAQQSFQIDSMVTIDELYDPNGQGDTVYKALIETENETWLAWMVGQ